MTGLDINGVIGPAPSRRNKPLWKSKTFWAGIAAIVTALGGALSGQMDVATAIQTAVPAVMGIFIRDGLRD